MSAELFDYLKKQISELDIFRVVDEDTKTIKDLAKKFEDCDDILIFGTGGSSLGGKSLVNFQALSLGESPRVRFVENTDATHFLNIINSCDPEKTGIVVISKSGRTTETLMLFLTLCEMWKDFDFENRAIAITELSQNNDLKTIAESKHMEIVEHNKNIGGRFSVFSVVGLLPALLEGFDIDNFLLGAKNVLNDIDGSKSFEDCKLFCDIVSMSEIFKSGKINQHVILPYSDLLEDFGKWATQLIAESLGKTEDFGITPIRAVGTVDQHSLLQLFLGGPSNKLFTVIVQKQHEETLKILNEIDSPVVQKLLRHNISELMLSHQKATIECLKKKAAVRVLEFEQFNAECLGFLMMLFFVEVVVIAKVFEINPFDQPAVEESKKLVMKYLSQFV